jgi:putative oxidoreductase
LGSPRSLVAASIVGATHDDRAPLSGAWNTKAVGLSAFGVRFPGPVFMGVQGILELVGGFLILVGLLTRPVAFILAGDMAVAYVMAHAPRDFFPTLNGGQLATLVCFVFLYLVFAGGGEWSVDAHIARRRSIA